MIFCLFLFLCCKDNTKKWIKSNILQEKWTNGDKNIFFIAKRCVFMLLFCILTSLFGPGAELGIGFYLCLRTHFFII